MAARRLPLRALVGPALGLAMGMTVSCLQADDFATEYAAEVCRMVRECDRELRLPGESEALPATGDCEAIVEAHYSSCGSSCNFDRRKARRCLRRLRDNECHPDQADTATDDGTGDDTATDDGTGDDTATGDDAATGDATPNEVFDNGLIPLVCNAVYEQCQGGDDQDSQCSAPSGCSIGDRAGEGWLTLLGLMLIGARRRWYLGHR